MIVQWVSVDIHCDFVLLGYSIGLVIFVLPDFFVVVFPPCCIVFLLLVLLLPVLFVSFSQSQTGLVSSQR